ncbi:MAG: hypothetical protein AAF631_14410, partial [Pseudomonadota bacterium]
MRVLLSLLALASPAAAETIVSPEAFQRMSEGRTMTFSRGGEFYGAEQFYTRRRSLWQYADGTCTDGEWYAEGDYICFVYEESPVPQCWHFIEKPGGFAARARGAEEAFDILLDR